MKAFIKKIEYVLPEKVIKNPDNKLTRRIGIVERHICEKNETASDLAEKAANKLFASGVDKAQIDYIILCTQSPDYYLPTTACILQEKLGIPTTCGAFDFNLGCSGYIYGLSISKGLIESGQAQNILFLTAETYSKYVNEYDGSVEPIFGDAATATLITSLDSDKNGIDGIVLGTDGAGFEELIVPVGGARNRIKDTEEIFETDKKGKTRSNYNLYMNGIAICDFALEVVPITLDKVLAKCDLRKSDIDYYIFHQANSFMLSYLQTKCDLLGYPYWNDIAECGNTVSCTIPIAIKDMMSGNREKNIKRILTIGFGVGLSWGGCVIDLSLFDNE